MVKTGEQMVGMLRGAQEEGGTEESRDFTTAGVLWCPKPRAETTEEQMGV